MSKNRKILFFCIVIAQIVFLGSIIFQRLSILSRGTTIVLKCEPVDPRSLFSGDYVELNYEISRLHLKTIKKIDAIDTDKNKILYVGLNPMGNTHWDAEAIASHPKKIKKQYPIFIKGRIIGGGNEWLSLQYGIETFFVPQFKGKMIEKQLDNIVTEIAVGSKGACALKRVFINGEEVTFR